MVKVGLLAVQGSFREHGQAFARLGVETLAVRRPAELDACDALVLPGGESTTIIKLLRIFELLDPIRARIAAGLPVLGTCAGMILLADRILGGTSDQETIGGLDVTVRRNAFGRQVDSFEEDLDFQGLSDPVHAVFIRAPWVEEAGPGVEILAESAGRIVAARQGKLMATSFHPEMGSDERVHDYFLRLIKS
ncbi:MAG TPA: pyridoxal 5'-phosphate synthase glutaminase subunit PdxT [Marmoricola sp.]|nr:pyridoxal 5'-phosphate synthase glutaminase subunit PdxT [Nocardioidaceae bacterium]HRV68750.1 pyridoxal 5'-phosphate synthase glutaminase subunit PdxT [Marmoricola sp.]